MATNKAAPKPRTKTKTAQIVTVDEAVDLYRGDWIVMRVTSFDAKKEPLAGVVVSHSRSHDRAFKSLGEELRHKKPEDFYYIFLGEPTGRTGEDLRKQLEELAAEEDSVRARRR
jgi:hypothetical protein